MSKRSSSMTAALAIAAGGLMAPAFADPCDGVWATGNPLRGLDARLTDSAFANVNGVNSVYILTAGSVAGSSAGRGVWRFDGTNFFPMPLPSDIGLGYAHCIAVYNGTVYVGGNIDSCDGQPAVGLIKWTGTQWTPVAGLAVQPNNSATDVLDMQVFDGELYLGGDLQITGQAGVRNIARYNGATMSGVGGFNDSEVRLLGLQGGGLVAYGDFDHAGPVAAQRIARWSGTSWAALGTGLPGNVDAMTVLNNELYAGGYNVLGAGTSGLAKWNGTTWSQVTLPNFDDGSRIRALTVFDNHVYMSGDFDEPGQNEDRGLAYLNGNSTVFVGGLRGGSVTQTPLPGKLFLLNNQLYMGGEYSEVSGIPAASFGRMAVGNTWSAVGPANSTTRDELRCVEVFDGQLVVGGYTRIIGGTFVNGVARSSDGVTWQGMGVGFDGEVCDLTTVNGTLYAGGSFFVTGQSPATNVARWNGNGWQALGGGVGVIEPFTADTVGVNSMCGWNGQLIVAGEFSTAGGQPAWSIAKWNGASWDNMGGGLRNDDNTPAYVFSVCTHAGQVFAGGWVEKAGPAQSINFVGRWDGAQWHDAGAGLSSGVFRLAEISGNLYAAAREQDATHAHIYRWTGASWTPASGDLGYGVPWALFEHDGDVMVGGLISYAAPGAPRLGRLVGNAIDPMPELRLTVRDGVSWNGKIAVVGEGGYISPGSGAATVSTGVAVWTPGMPVITDQPDGQTVCVGQDALFIVEAVSSNAMTYQWKRNNVALSDGLTPQGSTIVGAHLPMLRVQHVMPGDEGIYSCVITNACEAVTSDGARLIIGGCSCGPADLGSQGGVLGADGLLDNNDFVVFIDLFFQQNPAADFGSQGGVAPGDGLFDNNDFVVFIDAFFAGCNP